MVFTHAQNVTKHLATFAIKIAAKKSKKLSFLVTLIPQKPIGKDRSRGLKTYRRKKGI